MVQVDVPITYLVMLQILVLTPCRLKVYQLLYTLGTEGVMKGLFGYLPITDAAVVKFRRC